LDIFLELFNINGQRLMTRTLGQGTYFNESIDLSSFPKGMYYLVIRNKDGEVATKEVIKK